MVTKNNIANKEVNSFKKKRQFYFPAVIIIISLTLISQVFFIYSDWKSYQYFKETSRSKSNLSDLVTTISTLDEATTMSAIMCATTGDTIWKNRYYSLLPELDSAVSRAKREAPVFFANKAADQTDKANIKLAGIEKDVFRLIAEKKILEAQTLINSKEYKKQKQLYKEGFLQMQTAINKRNTKQYAEENKKFSLNMLSSTLLIALLAFIWFIIIRSARKYEKQLLLAEEARLSSDNKFHGIFINLQDAFIQTDLSGEILLASPSAARMFNYPSEDDLVMRKTIELYANPADRQKLFVELQDKGSVHDFIFLAQRKDRSTFWASINVQYQFDKNNQIVGISGVARDISDRIHTEELLQESRTHFKSVLDSTNDLIWSVDADYYTLMEWNTSFQAYFKEKRGIDILKGSTVYDIFSKNQDWIDKWNEYFQIAKTEGNFITEYNAIVEGQVFLLNINLIKHENHVFGISVFAKDITEIRAAEKEITLSRMRFQTMFEQAPLGITLNDATNDDILEVNEMFARIVGRTKEDIVTMGWENLTHPDDIQHQSDIMKRMNSGEMDSFNIRKRYIRPDNSVVWVNMTIARIQSSSTENPLYLRMIEDITNKKNNEDRIRTLSLAIEQSPVTIVITDVNGYIEYVNPKFYETTGYNQQEAVGKSPRILKSGSKSVQEYKELWQTITSKKVWRGEFLNIKKNGDKYYESASISPVVNEKGETLHFVAIKEDITERKLIENQLLDNEEQFRSTFEQAAVGIAHVAFDGKFLRINQRLCDIAGYTHAEMLSKNFQDITHPDFLEIDILHLEKLMTNQIKTYSLEKQYIHKSGNPIWINLTVAVKRKTTGESDYLITVVEDISIRKKAEDELRNFTSHLQNIREEEKRAIAREIHDDLGQILMAQKIDMGLLKKRIVSENRLTLSDDISIKLDNMISLIDKTIKSARAIMNGLRPEILETHGFTYTINNYLHEFELRNHIECEFNCSIPNLELSDQQSLSLFRIVQEALTNTVKYAQATLININITNSQAKLHLEIIDNGIGFDINTSGRKDSYGMIGMRERVILIDGKLDITSELGKGTSIKVEIPYSSL